MNVPPDIDGENDELLNVYRRASASDASGPSPEIRDAVLAQVRRQQAPAAANDDHWRWKAVAGIAVMGLIGLLASRGLRQAPPQADSVAIGPAPAPAPMVARSPRATSAPAATRMEPRTVIDAKVVEQAPLSAQLAAPAAQEANAAPPVFAGLDSPAPVLPAGLDRAAAPQGAGAPVAMRKLGAAGPSVLSVRRAVTERFSSLFLPQGSDQLNLVIVLVNERGEIERATTAQVAASNLSPDDTVVAERFKALGANPDQLSSPGFIRLVKEHTAAGTPELLLLVQYAWLR